MLIIYTLYHTVSLQSWSHSHQHQHTHCSHHNDAVKHQCYLRMMKTDHLLCGLWFSSHNFSPGVCLFCNDPTSRVLKSTRDHGRAAKATLVWNMQASHSLVAASHRHKFPAKYAHVQYTVCTQPSHFRTFH